MNELSKQTAYWSVAMLRSTMSHKEIFHFVIHEVTITRQIYLPEVLCIVTRRCFAWFSQTLNKKCCWQLSWRKLTVCYVADHRLYREEVRGEWRKLHSKELQKLYASPDIIKSSSRGE